ncbi:MAG TPA: DUF2306 domain-containing protein [Myxococcaceae bacterium]|nr:DUF2306 domain-containing protein [Myxococcaceae bacterium]
MALIAIPVAAGVHRLVVLAVGAPVTHDDVRFFAAPIPVVVHIIGASLFCVLGALQFAPAFRRRSPRWHRLAGRVLVAGGLAAALSGLWMTVFYPPGQGDGALLFVFRLFFGSGMAASLVLGFVAARRRDFASHRAWLARAYAIGMGAGTQALLGLPLTLIFGPPGVPLRTTFMFAGWALNLALAEWGLQVRRAHAELPAEGGGELARV